MKNCCQGELKIALTSLCFAWGFLLDNVLILSPDGEETPCSHPVGSGRKLEDEGYMWSDAIIKRQDAHKVSNPGCLTN